MSRLLRAWRVVCRERGRRWADGRIVPMTHDDRPPMTTGRMGAAEWVGEEGARDRRRAPFKWGGVGVAEGDQPGMDAWHHRGAATFAYVVELHVTPDVVAMPPGGRCDAVVHPTDSTGRRAFTEESDRRAAGSNEDPTGGGEGVPGPDPPREVPATLWDGTWVTCPVGAAVAIPNATRGAAHGTDVHVALPKHGDYDWAPTLERCYRSAMDVAWGYGVSHRPGDGAHMHGKDLTPLQRTAGRANNCSAESDARAVHADPSLDAALGVVAMPLLGVGTRWGVPVSAAAAAAARAMADYEPPAHLRTRVRRGASLHLGETAPVLFGPKFSVRFAAEDSQAAAELERALEAHLGQCYVPLSVVRGDHRSHPHAPPPPPPRERWEARRTAGSEHRSKSETKRELKAIKRLDRQEWFLYRLTGCWSGGKAGAWRSSSTPTQG